MQKITRKYKRGQGIGKSTKQVLDELTLDEMFDKFMNFKKTEALAPRTISEYYIHFNYLKDFLGNDITNESITLEDFRGYIGYMLHDKELAPMTVNIRIRTMRAFIRFCYTEGYINTPIHENFKPVKAPEDTLESLTPAEIKKLLSVIDDELYTGFRDKVIIFVLLDTLVRISELVTIKRSNVDLKGGFIQLEAGNTKTRKARTVPLSTKTVKLLKEYLKETEDFGDEYLFLTYDGHQINHATVRLNLRDYGKKANINNKRVSPHTFRHTGALFYIMNGGDPFSLQKILGHTDMSMVRKYIQMTDTDVKRQHNSFSPLNRIF
ncbi:tyrosine-type recombinase/integrase [Neobacillus sp. 179-C4.2 HS]|uniref:Tyrosine-type recombinase/integrase n=1 Tax=Neobacillus driksii TaxID=3035913 RepID=A0ABV4YUH0_9BACI|nr:tyrosine-type recombinase/integrase [Neobacillus sp. 179.-C4.2 HS]MDP5192734.1 tyrosine-type recombinase/integrase [Neobacillus sp. 179.-C4.2 HS]